MVLERFELSPILLRRQVCFPLQHKTINYPTALLLTKEGLGFEPTNTVYIFLPHPTWDRIICCVERSRKRLLLFFYIFISMIPLYTPTEFNNAKSMDSLMCQCYMCSNSFLQLKKAILFELKNNRGRCKFCSPICYHNFKNKKTSVICSNCNTSFLKKSHEIKKTKNNFCSLSCATIFNNKNKSHGTRRSKLEIWVQNQLATLYPNLQIDFNKKNAIGAELDIYIPSLKLAFELNGIFHYEPIFGSKKLCQIQENDISKSKACIETGIDLCIIDTSGQKYFKPSISQKYLDIIIEIIEKR